MRVFFTAFVLILVANIGVAAEEPAAAGPDVEANVCTAPADQVGDSQSDIFQQPEIFQKVGIAEACTASANCTQGPDVSCSGSNHCTAFDQNCSAGQQGYVECDGNRTWCATCPCNFRECRQECRSDCPPGCFCTGTCSNGFCECNEICF